MQEHQSMSPKKDPDPGPWKKGDKKDAPRKGGPLFGFNPGQFRFSIWYFVAAVVVLLVERKVSSIVANAALCGFELSNSTTSSHLM